MKRQIAYILLAGIILSLLTGCGQTAQAERDTVPAGHAAAAHLRNYTDKIDRTPEELHIGGAFGSGADAEAPTPTPAAKPAPSPAVPPIPANLSGEMILKAVGANISYPKTSSYLDSFAIRYVKSTHGGGVYMFSRTPNVGNYKDYILATIPDGTQTVILAQEAGAGCVMTDIGLTGWINLDYLEKRPVMKGSDTLCSVDSFSGNTARYEVRDAVAVDDYENITGIVDAGGKVSILYPSDSRQANPVYEKAKSWTDVRQLEMGFGVIVGVTNGGSLCLSADGDYYADRLSSLAGRTDVLDVSMSSYTDIAVTCAGGQIVIAGVLTGELPPLSVPAARRAVVSFRELFVLSGDCTVLQYEYDEETKKWNYLGVAAQNVVQLESADYNKDYAAAVLQKDGRVAVLGYEYGNITYLNGFENITDIAVGALLIGCDSDGNAYAYSKGELPQSFGDSLRSWGRIQRVGAGNYTLFGLG